VVALFVPAKTPDEIVQRLRAQLRRCRRPAVVQTISKAGSRSIPRRYSVPALLGRRREVMTQAVRKIGKLE